MEKSLLEGRSLTDLRDLLDYSNHDDHAEFEAKVLAGRIKTKDVADRIKKEIEKIAGSVPQEEHRLSYIYEDGIRVNVTGHLNIHKVCVTKSFAKIPLTVERKVNYFSGTEKDSGVNKKDVVDVSDYFTRFTLKHEKHIKKDHSGSADDARAVIRMIHRLSYKIPSQEFRIDFSMVKTFGKNGHRLIEILKLPPIYELEIEYTPNKERKRDPKESISSMIRIVERLIGAYQQSPFILPQSKIQKYAEEFKRSGHRFYNLVTLDRRNLRADRIGNILKDYTVTNKADGQRCALFVARDRSLLRVTPQDDIIWTGIQAKDDSHLDDFIDGEFIAEKNLFCIFDIYRFRNKNVKGLPLFTTDDEIVTSPESCRLGCARLFVEDINTEFVTLPCDNPIRIETKMFLAGDGLRMEEAIARVLDTKFEYGTDGLVFTPRSSAVAPIGELKGNTWTRVYKWKPPQQNTIDFLLRMDESKTVYDPILKKDVREGMLFISKNPGTELLYPCETMTGEYIPPVLPDDLQRIASSGMRAPAVFQPSAPRDPEAYKIQIPLDGRKLAVDIEGNRVENDTIIECSFDTDTRKWSVLRTRYDKTYLYRVKNQPQFGNDYAVAESVWTSIHVPVTEDMIRTCVTNLPDDTFEDDLYYRDDLDSRDRVLKQVYSFHNRIKETLYTNVPQDGTLLELGVGRGGDLFKWIRRRIGKVVGIDLSDSNITMNRQGACARYMNEKLKGYGYLPKALFATGDITKPLDSQDNKYLNIMFGKESAPTNYLKIFENMTKFDSVSCQFAMHYACESEETFKVFVENVKNHCKGTFFGTVLDGASVYTLLAGKNKHIFRKGNMVFSEIDKKYEDSGSWTDEFGMKIDVMLESLEKPQTEFLVPFDKVTQMFSEAGFDLVISEMFSEAYTRQAVNKPGQSTINLGQTEQDFSFLYRTFVFKKRPEEEKKEQEEAKIEEPEAEAIPELDEEGPPPLEHVTESMERREEAERQAKIEIDDEAAGQEEAVVPEPVPLAPEPPKPAPRRRKKLTKDESAVPAIVTAPEIVPAPAEEVPKPAPRRRRKLAAPAAPLPEIIFFYSKIPENKEFSNFYETTFKIDDVEFHSAEQAFQYMKAKTFGDEAMAAKILKNKSPKSAKAFGRKVSPFDPKVWDEKKDDLMRKILEAKFRGNADLTKKLLDTENKVLAEGSRDKYWAIGVDPESDKAKDPTKWSGKNVLGKMLEEVRLKLRSE